MVSQKHSLQSLSTFALPSYAANLLHLNAPEQLQAIDFQNLGPFYILGGGSNTIFLEDYAGTVIQPDFKGIEVKEHTDNWALHISAGENWHQLVCFCLENNMPGLENLALIPGNCGAAPIQNIGAYGIEFADFCEYVDWYNFETSEQQRLTRDECNFGYRDSIFKGQLKGEGVIVAVGMSIPKLWQPKLSYPGLQELQQPTPKQVFDTVVAIRQSKLPDPEQIPNVGSFFKNPVVDNELYQQLSSRYESMPAFPQANGKVKLAAGWLIDQCGLKGKQIGGTAVHKKQALVLTNIANGSGEDLVALATYVRQQVEDKFAIVLEPEVRLIGAAGETTLETAQ